MSSDVVQQALHCCFLIYMYVCMYILYYIYLNMKGNKRPKVIIKPVKRQSELLCSDSIFFSSLNSFVVIVETFS